MSSTQFYVKNSPKVEFSYQTMLVVHICCSEMETEMENRKKNFLFICEVISSSLETKLKEGKFLILR